MEVNSINKLSYSGRKELNLEQFKEKYFKHLSLYFNKIFSNYFTKIEEERIDDKNGTMIFHLQFDEKSANGLSIVHGGALATIIENLANVSLSYFVNTNYKTLDISINYKNQLGLNQNVQVYVKCSKMGYTTTFIEVEVKKEGEVCTQASIIKTKLNETKF
jgi:acyl-coenzyme A thioesterase PaaI-like protein